MYSSNRGNKSKRVQVNLSEAEFALLEALANLNGLPMATLLHYMVMNEALDSLGVSNIHEFDAISVTPFTAEAKLH
ncbi:MULTISPECIES: hypothetical protein [Chromohalobacter]|uniref:hypothetical protein n=1 Tax=Chromohalobacter TaxID=42054 RepID=UPI0015C4787E|nr:hypothetical protein [Chromohalobacter salexigens]NWO55016.1 hypothetical protein [Chromohalobacter salexigens]